MKNKEQYVMKTFITSAPHTVDELQLYELFIYGEKIKLLNNSFVCPYFVEFIAGGVEIPQKDFYLSILKDKVVDKNGSLVGEIQVANKFKENISIMFDNQEGIDSVNRGSIADPPLSGGVQYIAKNPSILNEIRLGYILTKKYDKPFSDVILTLLETDLGSLYTLIFQICIACYTMFLSGFTHNDLHLGNILIEEQVKPFTTRYLIDGNLYIFQTKYIPKLYDFDRGYARNFNNRLRGYEWASNSNHILNPRDFIKNFCSICLMIDRIIIKAAQDKRIPQLLINKVVQFRDDLFNKILKGGVSPDDILKNKFHMKSLNLRGYDNIDPAYMKRVVPCAFMKGINGMPTGKNDQSHFDDFHPYNQLIINLGDKFKAEKTVSDDDRFYILSPDVFNSNGSINKEKIANILMNRIYYLSNVSTKCTSDLAACEQHNTLSENILNDKLRILADEKNKIKLECNDKLSKYDTYLREQLANQALEYRKACDDEKDKLLKSMTHDDIELDDMDIDDEKINNFGMSG